VKAARHCCWVIGAMIGLAGAARADVIGSLPPSAACLASLTGPSSNESVTSPGTSDTVACAESSALEDATLCRNDDGLNLIGPQAFTLGVLHDVWPAGLAVDGLLGEDTPQVRQGPGGPGTTGLFLSAILTLGACHLARSARHLHVGHLPAWYHADAPGQIGHAVVFDLEYAPVAVCPFDERLPDQRPMLAYRLPRELRSRADSQSFLLIESPRAPPSSSI